MTERRLAAILVADVVGFSKLVGSDEAGTLAKLQALRTDIIEPAIGKHSGRLFKSMGDGFLVEFASAVQAVEAARAIQQANADGKLPLRIGIHVGDVVVQGDDLMGDGINVAARIEGIAEPGGIAISRAVHEQVRDKLDIGFEDKGEIALKNLARPVHVFSIAGSKPAAAMVPALALPDKPSIAVLPFQNMSGDPEQEYFADGMAEDILTGLSRHRWLFVIARNSSFTYKGRSIDVREVGRDLGVGYVLEGSVRRVGGRVRFTAQLIDTATGSHVWADKYDGRAEDLFELQDQITEAVVGVLEPTIQRAEIERTRRKRPESLGAYDHYLRGQALTDTFTRQAVDAMLEECLLAINLDPSFAPAYALAGRAHIQRHSQGWIVDESRARAEVLDLVERGLRADRLDPLMLGTAGHCFAWFARDLPKGIAYIDEAIAMNPNHAHAFLQSGVVRTRAGQARLAVDHLERARRLSPRDSRSYAIFQALALAHHVDGDSVTACDWARRAVRHNPNYLPGWYALAAAAGSAGEDIEARGAVERLLTLDPGFSIGRLARRYPISVPEKFEPILEGLRLAGLPE